MIGWRNAWSMKLRVQDQGEDQRGPGKTLFERTVKHARLSWPSWLVTTRYGIPARRRSPIPVVIGPDVRSLRSLTNSANRQPPCGVKLKDRLPSKALRERLGVDDIALILQQNRLRWYGHVLRKDDDDDWVKKCMEYEVEGSRPRRRPKRNWKEVVREDRQARKLNKEDAMDRCKWIKVIKEVRWPGWVWVGECFFWYRPTQVVPDKRPLNGVVVVTMNWVWWVTQSLFSSAHWR